MTFIIFSSLPFRYPANRHFQGLGLAAQSLPAAYGPTAKFNARSGDLVKTLNTVNIGEREQSEFLEPHLGRIVERR
jgi:hypothetical protein